MMSMNCGGHPSGARSGSSSVDPAKPTRPTSCAMFLLGHGTCRISSSHRTTPKLYTSLAGPKSSPRSTSGAIHDGEPAMCWVMTNVCSRRRAMPKSHSFTVPEPSRRTFIDFRSRCTTAGVRVCRYVMPLAMSRAHRSRTGHGIGADVRSRRSKRDSVHSSVSIADTSASMTAPLNITMFSWRNFVRSSTSRRNPSRLRASWHGKRFSATMSPVDFNVTRNTCPCAPAEICCPHSMSDRGTSQSMAPRFSVSCAVSRTDRGLPVPPPAACDGDRVSSRPVGVERPSTG
mmetsp:Transcript_4199/g.13388  ORF Transcript_4199/g.13388 Transcript_4199/m.13388 type:complete len:288 (-) Transcript_4199:922-1785(-)